MRVANIRDRPLAGAADYGREDGICLQCKDRALRPLSTLLALILALGCSACGGSSGSHGATTGATATPTVTLSAPTHHPSVGAPWPIVIQARDSAGAPLQAEVRYEFLFAGRWWRGAPTIGSGEPSTTASAGRLARWGAAHLPGRRHHAARDAPARLRRQGEAIAGSPTEGTRARRRRPRRCRDRGRAGLEEFAGRIEALREVSLRVAPGEVVALTGPSGCGKTHPAQRDRRDRARRLRTGAGRRQSRHRALPPDLIPARHDRLRLPAPPPAADADRAGERRAAADRRRGAARRAAPPCDELLAEVGLSERAEQRPASSRAASASESRWRGRWPTSRACCSPTSRPARSTPRAAAAFSPCSIVPASAAG